MQFQSFQSATDAMRLELKTEFREKLPFAAIVALTRTAVTVRDMVRGEMKRVFDRPTLYALNAARAVPATKQTMASAVVLRDFGGTPAENYLGPEIEGGERRSKRSESALRHVGILPSGMFTAPGSAAKIDQYGNQSRGQIVQILSAVKAFGETGYTANATKKSKARRGGYKTRATGTPFFAGKSRTNGDGAIYQVTATGHVAPVLAFIHRPEYHKRLDFYGYVARSADKVFPFQLDAALEK